MLIRTPEASWAPHCLKKNGTPAARHEIYPEVVDRPEEVRRRRRTLPESNQWPVKPAGRSTPDVEGSG